MLRTIGFAVLAMSASLIAGPALAASSPVVGTWATVAETQMGKFEATMTVTEADGGYKVEIVDAPMTGPDGQAAPAMPSIVSDVKIDGSKFSFKRVLSFQDMQIELNYAGTVDGDKLTAEANSSFGSTPVTGTRKS